MKAMESLGGSGNENIPHKYFMCVHLKNGYESDCCEKALHQLQNAEIKE